MLNTPLVVFLGKVQVLLQMCVDRLWWTQERHAVSCITFGVQVRIPLPQPVPKHEGFQEPEISSAILWALSITIFGLPLQRVVVIAHTSVVVCAEMSTSSTPQLQAQKNAGFAKFLDGVLMVLKPKPQRKTRKALKPLGNANIGSKRYQKTKQTLKECELN